ncbi:MAG: cellulase family glycosylhydrolase [Candidatus Aenigmatarchaeota archaeon]
MNLKNFLKPDRRKIIIFVIIIVFVSLCIKKQPSPIGGGGSGGPSSPPSCSVSLSLKSLGVDTCTITATITANHCDNKSYEIRDTTCSGTINDDSFTKDCGWSVSYGDYSYDLYVDGKYRTSKSITCSESIKTCSDETPYGECSVTKPLYCDNDELINKCSLCECPLEQLCNETSEECYTHIECSGSVLLNLTPSNVEPDDSVIPSASGLTDCGGKTIYFKNDSCAGTEVSSCTLTDGECTGSSFTAPSSEGLYTYYACIDKNSDGDFTDSGDYSSKTLDVFKVIDVWLHTDGKYIKDSQGNVVILHGINFIGYQVTQPEPGYYNHIEADYQKIASWGFNVVRLPISWQHFEPTEGNFNESYFTNFIDKDIEWAQKHGIYIIIGFMQWRWSPYFTYTDGGYGFPSWLFDGYPNSEQGKQQSQDDFWLGKGPNGTEATPENPSMQNRMIQAWKYIVERYKNNPTVLAYDLFNEPPPGTLGASTTANYLYPFYERIIDNITIIDRNHIFMYEPPVGRWDFAPRLLNRQNIIFSTHTYPGYYSATKPPLGYSGDITVLKNQFNGYLDLPLSNPSKSWNIPILLGEFGPSTFPIYPNRILWVNDMADVCNEYNIHWIYWDYGLNPGNKWSIINPDRTEIKEKADALDKPYPRVNSIPPSEYSFDRNTKHFKVIFDDTGSVETKIYVPYRYYPDFAVNSNSSSWSDSWNESSRILTVLADLEGPIEITIDAT